MNYFDFNLIIRNAWHQYQNQLEIISIFDLSVNVSTNRVYKVILENGNFVIAKLAYYGSHKHFSEDHNIINKMCKLIEPPFRNFLSSSLLKKNEVFVFQHTENELKMWCVFYNPVEIQNKLPAILNKMQIEVFAKQMALFHKKCNAIANDLPHSSKTLLSDINALLLKLDLPTAQDEYKGYISQINNWCAVFLENIAQLGFEKFRKIPVFIDWNSGNFSINENGTLFSRWDYDWFRISSRVLDFYFCSRLVSKISDKTVFSYSVDTLMEDGFAIFLKSYHKVYPISKKEILFIKEAYRFFLLNYVIKDGKYFFQVSHAQRLQKEALEYYLPHLDMTFDADKLLNIIDAKN